MSALGAETAAVLELAYRQAGERWGALAVGLPRIAESIAAIDVDSTRLGARGAEIVLAHAAAAADPVAVAAFESEAIAPSRSIIQRYACDDTRTDEIVQQLRIHLLIAEGTAPPRLSRFDGRAPLGAWIAMCAARLALHRLRNDRTSREVAVEWSEALADLPAHDPLVERQRTLHVARVTEALRDACLSLSRRQRAVLRLIFVDGASVDELASMYQVHRVTVWRWVQEARAALGAHVRDRLATTDASLIAWVQDQVELSLDAVLASTATHER